VKKSIVKYLWALAALAALPASAISPENGWYWNPNESGRGINIEIQDNILFMAAFVYRADGTPAWYVAGGPMSNDKTFSADLFETSGGQCLGCAYRAPGANKIGTASIAFISERSATVTLPGATLSVTRQDWSGLGSRTRDALMGEWSSTEGEPSTGVYAGDRISLFVPQTDQFGPFVSGFRTGVGNTAVGEFNTDFQYFTIVLDSSTQFYKAYIFTLDAFNRAQGGVWTYAKGSQPTGAGSYFVSHRTKSGAYVRTGTGPAILKSAAASAAREAEDARAAAQAPAGETPAGLVEAVKRLEGILRQR
jgi:hypothetical protein